MIYLDNAATTKVFDEVISEVTASLKFDYFNPSSLYSSAVKVQRKMDNARENIAYALMAKPNEIIFTSGATEANNWAITCGMKQKKGNIVSSYGEHPSVHETLLSLKNQGVEVRFSPLKKDGTVDEEKFLSLIDENTSLVSLIHRSNETGAINDILTLSKKAKQINQKLVFHSDGVQGFLKLDTNLHSSDIDLYSISAHKIGGMKGTGVLYKNEKLNIRPLILGGGQEKNLRSGTENVTGILAFSHAVAAFQKHYNRKKIAEMSQYISNTLCQNIAEIKINSPKGSDILSISFHGKKSEIIQRLLFEKGILIGTGSACASRLKYNRVLEAMGVCKQCIEGSIRVSIGAFNTLDEAKQFVAVLTEIVNEQ
ncbi:MAG: cysteine desulfurase [Firmicutes bacterium]|nr:cysteine desulfurase [Bacillota bacterium]